MASGYDDLDLSYPEIAIAVESISKLNATAKAYKFIIPVLTPTYSSTSEVNKTIRQTSNISNADISISNISMSNTISLIVPPHLLALPPASSYSVASSNITITGTETISGDGSISGSVSEDSGMASGTLSSSGDINITNATASEVITPSYSQETSIAAGSKWIVVFVGGDINKPQIIGRYYE